MRKTQYQPKILIVDDNNENLDLLTIILAKINVNIIAATSGSDALIKTNGVELALAIVDVRMPVMTGYELAVKLNESREENKVPVIFLTANHFDYDEVLNGYKAGAVDYITKPYSQQILLSKVNVFLDLFNQKQTIRRNAELLNKSYEQISRANEILEKREQKLLKQQLFNKALLDSLPGIYFLYTFPEFKMVGWNKQHETIFGYESDEMLGKSIFDWHEPENKNMVLESLNNFDFIDQVSLDTLLVTKDGRKIPFLLTSVKFESEGQQYLIGVGTNVSEQKEAEQSLILSESTLNKAQKIAHMGSWEYIYATDIMNCSDETLRIFGYPPGGVRPSLDLFFNMTHPDDFLSLRENIVRVLELHEPLSIDMRIILEDGEERFIHEQAELTYDDNGEIVKLVGTVHDITQRKKIEEEQKRSLAQLKQLSVHIEQAREDERLNISRELHDDLGQALTAVKIDLEIIKQQSTDAIVKDKLDSVKALVGGAIKSVQKITSQLRPEIIDDLGLEAAIDWYSNDFSKRYGIEVFLDIDSEIFFSKEKSLSLFRIVQESLTNIARHAHATHVEILLNKQGDDIQLVIADNGVGISDDHINSKNSFGIMSLKERAEFLGGSFEISKGEKFGSKILINFPINMINYECIDL